VLRVLTVLMDLIRFGGRVDYVDLTSWSFVVESIQAVGGIGISVLRPLVAAAERPVEI
jgi:hypothetical protein